MQIETIETAKGLLENWGRYARRDKLGTEYPSEQPFVGLMRSKGGIADQAMYIPHDDEKAEMVDGWLAQLALQGELGKQLHALIWDYYLVQHTYREIARRHDMSTQKVCELLRTGEGWVSGVLTGLSIAC